jgi:hypothetical protein
MLFAAGLSLCVLAFYRISKASDETDVGLKIASKLVDRDDLMGKSLTVFLTELIDDDDALSTYGLAEIRVHGWMKAENVYVSYYQEDDCINMSYWRSYRYDRGTLESIRHKRSDTIQGMKAEICEGNHPDAKPYSAMADVATRAGR